MIPPIHRVFLSYAREDAAWAQEQARVLRSAGLDVFLDVLTLRAGDDWAERIHAEIARADQVRVGWSRYAQQSEWVKREYMEALRVSAERGAGSFLLVDRLDETGLPPELKHIHAERSALSTPEADRLIRDPYRELPRHQEQVQPSMLLRAEYHVVPFHGREQNLEDTERWCLSRKPFDLTLYVGPGGSGKTRLFAEACARLRMEGWESGFLDGPRTQDALRAAPDRLDALLHPRLPRLIVVDYAESRRDEVEAILRRAVDKRDGEAVRLVLLARTAEDWWLELLQSSADFRPLAGDRAAPIQLPPLTPSVSDRRSAFRAALGAFAGALGAAAPFEAEVNLQPPHLGQALYLHLRALLAVMGGHGATPDELLARLLEHEERYWRGMARKVGLDPALQATLAPAVALVTLLGGVAAGEELQRLLARSPLLSGRGVPERRLLGDLLTLLYGWEGRVDPLQPDRVGESLVERELSRDASLRHSWYGDADPAQLRQGLTVLSRVAMGKEDVHAWLEEILSADTRRLARAAMDVAVEGNEPASRALTRVMESRPDAGLSRELEKQLPKQTVALRELGIVVTTQAADATDDDAERARLLSNLAVRMSRLGRREEALTMAREAVRIRRRLAEADPGEFLPRLAMSLNNLSNRLSDMARFDEAALAAEEALEIYRGLASTRPDAFLPGVAMSLINLANRLGSVGRVEEAVSRAREGVEIFRSLAEVDEAGYLPDLAASLNNLGNRLSQAGAREEALAITSEAVERYRRMAEVRPDAASPDLASALNSLSERLSDLDHDEEALVAILEAVSIRRGLAERRPDAFRPELAESLVNLGDRLRRLGRHEAAARWLREAVEHYRRLVDDYPDTFLPRLASGLTDLGGVLTELGLSEEGAAVLREGDQVRAQAANPSGARPAGVG